MQMSRILFTVCHPCLQRSTKQVWSWGCVSDDSYHWEAHWQNRHCFISFPVLKRLICPSRREALLPICISIWPCVYSWHFLQPANVSRGAVSFLSRSASLLPVIGNVCVCCISPSEQARTLQNQKFFFFLTSLLCLLLPVVRKYFHRNFLCFAAFFLLDFNNRKQ